MKSKLVKQTFLFLIMACVVSIIVGATAFAATLTGGTARISAVDMATGEELEGATLQILDFSGDLVDEWVSTTEIHVIEGLNTDEEYTLKATVAPDGYTIPTETTFVINSDGTITTTGSTTTDSSDNTVILVEFEKTQVEVLAVKASDDSELEGVIIQVCDSDGNIVEEWESTTETHLIEGLRTGEEYTIKVTVVPDDYVEPSGDVCTFTIDEEGNVTSTGTIAEGVILVGIEETEPATYTVTLNPNGGGSVTPTKIEVTEGQPYGELPIPTPNGDKTFNGWYREFKKANLIDVYNPDAYGRNVLRIAPGSSYNAGLFSTGDVIVFDVTFSDNTPLDVDVNDHSVSTSCYTISGNRIYGSITLQNSHFYTDYRWGYSFLDINCENEIDGYTITDYKVFEASTDTTRIISTTEFNENDDITLYAGWSPVRIEASSTALTTIDSVDVAGIIAPVAGESPVVDGITITTTGLSIKEDTDGAMIYWYSTNNERRLESTDTFEADDIVYLNIYLDVEEGYELAEVIMPTANIGTPDYLETEAETGLSIVPIEFEVESPEIIKHTIAFNANGGTGEMEEIEVEEGSSYTLPACTFTAPNGKKFGKWDKGEKGTEITITEDTTLTAEWVNKSSGSGSASTPSSYKITTKIENGTVTPNTAQVKRNESKEFKFEADEGYEIKDVLVDNKSIGAVDSYTIEKVTANYTIEVKTVKITKTDVDKEQPSSDSISNLSDATVEKIMSNFTDVSKNDPFYSDVKYAVKNRLFSGISKTEFGPNIKITRGMLVTVLYKFANGEEIELSDFEDVDKEEYYSAPIAWATKNGFVSGIGDNKFAPDANVTKQDLATILYKYVKSQGKGFNGMWTFLLDAADRDEIEEYAYEPVCWFTMNNVYATDKNNKINPTNEVTRIETIQIFRKISDLLK